MALLPPLPLGSKKDIRTVGRGCQPLVLIGFTLIMTAVIEARLVYLQIIEGAKFRHKAATSWTRVIAKPPQRGNIFDRNGKVLASTRYSRSLYLWPMAHTKPSWSVLAPLLEKILHIPQRQIEQQLEQVGANSPSLVRIARDLNPMQITALQKYVDQLPEVEIHTEPVRYYLYGEKLSHVLGYTQEFTHEQGLLTKQAGDVIGQMGVEKAYDHLLRGEWGVERVEVDDAGRPQRVWTQKQAKAGKDLHLTIDLALQTAADQALGKYRGAIVVIDPKNGAVLAMTSRPTFDPNIFSQQKLSAKDWETLKSQDRPLVNRALKAFPPASIFKIVTTTAALESGKFTPDTVLPTSGSLRVDGVSVRELNRAGFGPLEFPRAIAVNSDTFFFQVARKIGDSTLITWSHKFGFGQKTGIELADEESTGLVPHAIWKQQILQTPGTVDQSINMSIGQGTLQITPLQSAIMFAIPANGGYRVQPQLLKNQTAATRRSPLNMKPDTVGVLREGLRRVVSEGTGQSLNLPAIAPASGQSGTAQALNGRPHHTWFGAYAPSYKPEIVVVAFSENSGADGSTICAPMVLQVLKAYFQHKYSSNYAKVYPRATVTQAQDSASKVDQIGGINGE
ncbi:penicillin-binding protein 2 [Fortiea contorta]|uniref:penicillin-binding protein 2 n=1 Tax=Fortiea contorta TaxID=1892405 RepID=UPI00034A64BA|nr:penicillin-binding protein 2 [Fortiea contorta]